LIKFSKNSDQVTKFHVTKKTDEYFPFLCKTRGRISLGEVYISGYALNVHVTIRQASDISYQNVIFFLFRCLKKKQKTTLLRVIRRRAQLQGCARSSEGLI